MARGPEDYGNGTPLGSGQTIAALNGNAKIDLQFGVSVVAIQIAPTSFAGTLVFEGSQDGGSTWKPTSVVLAATSAPVTSLVNAGGNFLFVSAGYSGFRVRASVFTSGSAVVVLVASAAGMPLPTSPAGTVTGTLTTITTDTVVMPILGGQWATAQFTATTAGTSKQNAQISIDGGTNWINPPYAKRLSTANANPTMTDFSLSGGVTLVAGDVWEIPLPGNVTHFRLICGTTGTATSVSLMPGLPYISGAPVHAVLYDQTSGTNAILDTGVIDTSGWGVLSFAYVAGATGSMAPKWVDDSGATFVSLTSAITGVAAVGTFGDGSSASNSVSFLPKRVEFISQAIAAQTSRIRIEVRR